MRHIKVKRMNLQVLKHEVRLIIVDEDGLVHELRMEAEEYAKHLANLDACLKEHQQKFPEEWNPDGTPRGLK